MICPECQTKLQIDKNPNGILWQCNHCSGVAANLAILRKQLNPDIVQSFWRRSQSSRISSRKCPSCQRPLKNFTSFINNRSINLDLCKQCQIVWFDEGELAPFSKTFAHEDKLSPEVRRELAICKLQYQKDCKEQIEKDVSEISRWIYILTAILRLLVWISLDV